MPSEFESNMIGAQSCWEAQNGPGAKAFVLIWVSNFIPYIKDAPLKQGSFQRASLPYNSYSVTANSFLEGYAI